MQADGGSHCFYFNGGWEEGGAGAAAAAVLDVREEPHACERNGSADDCPGGQRVAEVEERNSDDENAAHAVGDTVGDGGGCSEEGKGGVVVHEVGGAAQKDCVQGSDPCGV